MLFTPIAPNATSVAGHPAPVGRVLPALAAAMNAQLNSWERDLAAAEASVGLPPLAEFFEQCQGVVSPAPVLVVGESVLEPLSALVVRNWGHADGEEQYDPADGDAVRRQEGEDEEWPEDNQDNDFHGEYPEDEQRDSYGPDDEQEAIGDMHSSQYD
jgi:hypothetical protein